jgi:hypothetical protein
LSGFNPTKSLKNLPLGLKLFTTGVDRASLGGLRFLEKLHPAFHSMQDADQSGFLDKGDSAEIS